RRRGDRGPARGEHPLPGGPGPGPPPGGGRGPSVRRRCRVIVVMKADAGEAELQAVVARIEELGLRTHLSHGEHRTLVGVIGQKPQGLAERLMAMDGVDRVVSILQPYDMASREYQPTPSRVPVGPVEWGPAPSSPRSSSWRRPKRSVRRGRCSSGAAPSSLAPRPTPSKAWPRTA